MKKPAGFNLLLICLVIPGCLKAQDSIMYRNAFEHAIVDGKDTPSRFTRNQKTYTPDGRIVREINYRESPDTSKRNMDKTILIHDVTFYFYKGDKIDTEETYDEKDSLCRIIRHSYNHKDQETEQSRYERIEGKLAVTGRTTYEYDDAGNMIWKKDYGVRKKPFRITGYSYSSGKLTEERCVTKKPPDGIPLRIITCEYQQDNGKLMSRKISEIHKNKAVNNTYEFYHYNEKTGSLTKIEIKDADGQVLLIKNYRFLVSGDLIAYFEQDKDEKMLLYNSFEYKQHKTSLIQRRSYFDRQ